MVRRCPHVRARWAEQKDSSAGLGGQCCTHTRCEGAAADETAYPYMCLYNCPCLSRMGDTAAGVGNGGCGPTAEPVCGVVQKSRKDKDQPEGARHSRTAAHRQVRRTELQGGHRPSSGGREISKSGVPHVSLRIRHAGYCREAMFSAKEGGKRREKRETQKRGRGSWRGSVGPVAL